MTDVWHIFANVEHEPWKDLRLIKALRLATDQRELFDTADLQDAKAWLDELS